MPKFFIRTGFYDQYQRAELEIEAPTAREAMEEARRLVDEGEVQSFPHTLDPGPTWIDFAAQGERADAADVIAVPLDLCEEAVCGSRAIDIVRRLLEVWETFEEDGPTPIDDLIAEARQLIGPTKPAT
jgi:hypothetical protein